MRGLVTVLGIVLSAHARATTIVAIWTPVKLVISGDSLINSNWTVNGMPHHGISNDCKIRKFGTNYISAAGNYLIRAAGFDLWAMASNACGSSTSVDECTSRFSALLRYSLGRAASQREVQLSVLVAGVQNGAPALDHITLMGSPQMRLRVQSESFRRGRQKWGRVILGERGAIDRYEAEAASTVTNTIQDQALSLVRVEARALPQEVGAPFSTLAIVTAGEHWIIPGCCPSSCSK